MTLRLTQPLRLASPPALVRPTPLSLCCSAQNHNLSSLDTRKLVLEVREKLEEYPGLPTGRNGRDDEDMIFWFLKDRRFSVEETVPKLTKAIIRCDRSSQALAGFVALHHYKKWHQEFGVSGLSIQDVGELYGTRKAYVHDHLDIYGRPVLLAFASKHYPAKQDASQNEKLCVLLIEEALRKLPSGIDQILGIYDLRGFGPENGDISFLKFLIDVFYGYYPRRLGQVLFVDPPFVFQPIWQLIKPWMKSYASLVRFCNAEAVRKEYFTEQTVPPEFRG